MCVFLCVLRGRTRILSSPGWEEGGNEFSANVHSYFQMNLLLWARVRFGCPFTTCSNKGILTAQNLLPQLLLSRQDLRSSCCSISSLQLRIELVRWEANLLSLNYLIWNIVAKTPSNHIQNKSLLIAFGWSDSYCGTGVFKDTLSPHFFLQVWYTAILKPCKNMEIFEIGEIPKLISLAPSGLMKH